MSDFRIQIVHASTGGVVQWKPGHSIEEDIVEALCTRLKERSIGVFRVEPRTSWMVVKQLFKSGVGLWSTEATVLAAVREEFAKLLWDLKSKV